MPKVIVIAQPDGGVAILYPSYRDGLSGVRKGRTEADVLADVLARGTAAHTRPYVATEVDPETDTVISSEVVTPTFREGIEYRVVDEADLPASDAFRAAWRFEPQTGVRVDVAAAKALKLAAIRAARQPKLDALDRRQIRASDLGLADEYAAILAEKQRLRDLPQTVVLPDDLAALEALWPAELAP
jgi:hypothetical protein